MADSIDVYKGITDAIILTSLITLILFVGFNAQLLPTWIFINSLSLVLHTPLLSINMPSNLHYTLVSRDLDLLRLSTGEGLQEEMQSSDLASNLLNY